MDEYRKQLALNATAEEAAQFEAIKQYHKRSSDSDTIRFLIHQEAEKIFAKNITGETLKGGKQTA